MMRFGYGMGGWGGPGWGEFGWIGGLLFLALIVFAIVLLARSLGWDRHDRHAAGRPGEPAGEDRALQILRERYARGEIDKEEFDRRKEGLA